MPHGHLPAVQQSLSVNLFKTDTLFCMSHFVITLATLCNKLEMNGRRTSNSIISIITDNNNNKNNDNNNNNSNNNCNNYNDSDNDSNNKILIFSSGGGGKCSHQLRPSGFKIFVGKYNSFYADDLENMR